MLLLAATADAHASVTQPRQRGEGSYCAHCVGITAGTPSNPGGPDVQPGVLPYNNGPCGFDGNDGRNYNTPGSSANQNSPSFGYEPSDTYSAGQIIDVGLYWNAPHGGWHQFRVCPNSTMNEWFTTPGYAPDQSQMDSMETCFAANPVRMLGDNCEDFGTGNGWCHLQEGEAPTSTQIQLPGDFTCEHCLLHWRWDAWRSGNEIYNQCSDIRVV